MALAGSKPPALTVNNVVKACKEAGVKWSQDLCLGLRIPQAEILKIETSSRNSELELKLSMSIQYWMIVDPTPSWRRIISMIDNLRGGDASKLYPYAEPITDPSLTLNNVRTVMEKVRNLTDANSLAFHLKIPGGKRESVKSIATYWLSYGDKVSWAQLASKLYFIKEESALEAAKQFLPAHPPDKSLTLENIIQALEGVGKKWFEVGKEIGIPQSELERIKREHINDRTRCRQEAWKVWLDNHPATSWERIVEGLYHRSEHDVLDQLERQYPTVHRPTLSNLTLIKWTNSEGNTERFKLIESISSNWREIGIQVGISKPQLDMFRQTTLNNIIECCQNVISHWLEGCIKYPRTWDGLYELLEDVDYAGKAEELKEALKCARVQS